MKYVVTFLLVAQLCASCSSTYDISKARAYVRERIAGTIQVDDNGRPLSNGISEEHLVFIETIPAQPLPEIATVWVKQKSYAATLVEMTQPNQHIGKTVKGEEVTLTPAAGHKLWQLVLTPKPEGAASSQALAETVLRKRIVLTGTWRGENFVYAFDKEDSLEPLQFQ